MRVLLFVAIGGALGSVGRYLIGLWMRDIPGIPWETFAVNVAGSLVLGFLAGVFAATPNMDVAVRTGITVGVLGGFTTFSTFTVESVEIIGSGRIGAALFNLIGSVVLGLVAAAVGLVFGRAVAA